MDLRKKFRKSLFEIELKSYVKENIPKKNLLDCYLGTNPYGFPKEIIEDLSISDFDFSKYPTPHHDALREKLVEYWGGLFKKENVFIGIGSMGCLEDINKFAITEGSIVLGYSPQFSEYVTQVRVLGGVYDYVLLKKENNFEFKPEEFISKIRGDLTLIYIDNPNNPTGQTIPIDVIEEIVRKALSKDIVVIVDEAYGDFEYSRNSALNLDYPNLIVVRSFSKGFGLANLRVGYSVVKGQDLRELYSKIYIPIRVSSVAEVLAIKVLEKAKGYLSEVIKKISEEKSKLLSYLRRKGLYIGKTSLNVPIFLLHKEGVDLHEYLINKGILTTDGSDFIGLDSSYVRVRIPPKAEMFIERLEGSS